jgi:hypothetical protein
MRLHNRIPAVVLTLIVGSFAPSTAVANQRVDRDPAPAGHGAPDFTLPAVALRISLDRVLAEHAFLIVEAMRTGVGEGDDFRAAGRVLEDNTVDLLALVDAAYGAEAADAFGRQWRNHIAFLIDYTRAVAEGDDDARELAASQLEVYTTDFSALLSSANPDLPPDVVEGLIREHVEQLEQIGSFADADYGDAYPAIRATFEHMFMIGDGLTHGIVARFGDRFPGSDTAFSPALDLRIDLDRILGEHTFLAAIGMRARLGEGADLDAAVAALDANSAEFASKIGAIYGVQAEGLFDRLWRSHTDYYLQYVAAVAEDDAASQNLALDGLRQYRSDFSTFLSDANPFLAPDDLESMLAAHTGHLIDQVTSYAEGDFDAAYGTLREAYAQTGDLAAGLGGAIAEQFPGPFPDAGMSVAHREMPWQLTGALLLALAAFTATRRATRLLPSGRSRDRGS